MRRPLEDLIARFLGEENKHIVFYCKAGRHRSFALLIAFPMYSTHVRNYFMWADLVSEVRNQWLQPGRGCELTSASDPNYRRRHIPHNDVLHEFGKYLDKLCLGHRWPYTL